jgi:flagellar hook-associated protein 3 FlgL
MSRVSEKSSLASLNFNIGQAKKKMEDLQLRGSSLKKMSRPSDDPIGNMEMMQIRSRQETNKQYRNNVQFGLTLLDYTENAIKEVSDLLLKVKELAVGQASDLHNKQVRLAVSREVSQLSKQLLGISNRRVGGRYIFAGHKTTHPPFNIHGQYYGDDGISHIEAQKDFFVPINFPGSRIFFNTKDSSTSANEPLANFPSPIISTANFHTSKKGINQYENPHPARPSYKSSLFNILFKLESALKTGASDAIQDLLESIDSSIDKMVNARTQVGTLISTLNNTENNLEEFSLIDAQRKSHIEDADVAELFSDLTRQDQLLKASYKTGSRLMQQSLIDYLR